MSRSRVSWPIAPLKVPLSWSTGTAAETGTRTGVGTRAGSGRAEKRGKNATNHESCRRDVGNGGDLSGKKKNVDKKVLLQ